MSESEYEGSGNSAWDARQDFSRLIVFRISQFQDPSLKELEPMLEQLTKLHDLVRAWYPDADEGIEKKIHEIEALVYGRANSEETFKNNKEKALKAIRDTFSMIMKEIRMKGLLLPEKESKNPYRAFADYYPQ